MRRIPYIYQSSSWPNFKWQQNELSVALAKIHQLQGRIAGRMMALGFQLQNEAVLQTLTLDVLKSSEIEGENLDKEQVRSSVARHLGMDIAGLVPADRHVDGVVEMMLDATQQYERALTADRLFGWHASLFPGGRSGMQKILSGAWRKNSADDPMQVVSGAMGHERVHFEAPPSQLLEPEMEQFLTWFNTTHDIDPVLKAGIAHLWFVTVHPFDDGNGRIARAIADLQLARSDGSPQRFYSMSAQIRKERNDYYTILEKTQKGTLDITAWLHWFLVCLHRALLTADETLSGVLKKATFWEAHATSPFNERQRVILIKLLGHFEGKLTTSKWAKITGCSPDTALRDLQDLVEKGVLVKDSAGGRSSNYLLV